VTNVERGGRTIAALVHDSALDDEPDLVETVAAAAGLALENERLQADLRAQFDFLETVVETMPALLVVIDTEGAIVSVNPSVAAAYGLDAADEIVGRRFWDVFIAPEEREAMVARFRAAAPDFPPAEYENRFTNAVGAERVIAWRSAPVVDESGDVLRIVSGGLDITERKRQEEELRASRTRLVEAESNERRRLERNLHDGAQQRLVSLALSLRLAESRLAADPAGAAAVLRDAQIELSQALEELRELARGIHPAILTERGLTPAIRALAARAPLPVELDLPDDRLPEPVEAAAYYVVAEALTNVTKYSHASAAEVSVTQANGLVTVEVADDGDGGADPDRGSGLRGLADRLAALDGTLDVDSPPGDGTRVRAVIPVPADPLVDSTR
jgi:PAS domain S-box-containing protein